VRIGIDARELCGKPTGVGRYLAHLLTAWQGLPEASAHEFLLYVPGDTDTSLSLLLATPTLPFTCRRVGGGSGTWWEQVHLARAVRQDRPDVLFSPAYTAPLATAIPVVLTIHDLSFLAHPEWFPRRMQWRQRVVTTLAAKRARRLLTVSEFSSREIVRLLGVPGAAVSVVHHGLTLQTAFRRDDGDGARQPIILFVGSIFNRRHLPELIRAVSALACSHPDVRLEIVGDNRTFPRQDLEEEARAAGVAAQTTIRSYVSDGDLAELYGSAGGFAFLSDYEGFGLTPLEALAHGVPIVVGDTPVAREVYGNAAAFVSTTDVAAAAGALERLLFDPSERRRLLQAVPAVLARYSWERAGRQTLDALLEAARS
jgi:glycosyltransferase involved in cell wall biosynthesis